MIRIGIEGKRLPVLEKIRAMGLPVLVSANSIWNDKKKRFGVVWKYYEGLDIALDSGGFTSHRHYGGYRFSPAEYAALAKEMQPTWWAQMDFCCEPEIAANQREVFRRIDLTVEHLHACNIEAHKNEIQKPLIVLQGWRPIDYVCGPAWENSFDWPSLVGVGSVCRRHIHGPDGLLAVLAMLDRKLPEHVKLHFFGVKGYALRFLTYHPRFASMDSMAWNIEARHMARRAKVPGTNEYKSRNIEPWVKKQIPPQMSLGI